MAQVIPSNYGSQCQGGVGVRGFSQFGKPSLLLSLIPVGRSFLTQSSFFLGLWAFCFLFECEQEVRTVACAFIAVTTDQLAMVGGGWSAFCFGKLNRST